MRAITKLMEPASLAQYRAGADTAYEKAYDEYPDKKTVRSQLVEEQRGLCAFCGCRIVNDPLRMKIAHWKPRKLRLTDAHGVETYPILPDQLAYWNMLGCCNGGEGQPPDRQHCDTHQGNMPLSKNPANPAHRVEEIISFLTDGSIASSDNQFNRELGCRQAEGTFDRGVLNLNLAFLRNNRVGALDAFKATLIKRGHLTKAQVSKLLTEWNGDQPGELKAYAPVIAYWLKKRLARES